MFPHRVDRISPKNRSIVDSPRSSILLASRLPHEKKNCRPQTKAFHMGQTCPPFVFADLELRYGQYLILIMRWVSVQSLFAAFAALPGQVEVMREQVGNLAGILGDEAVHASTAFQDDETSKKTTQDRIEMKFHLRGKGGGLRL